MKKNFMNAVLFLLLLLGGQMNLMAQNQNKDNKERKRPTEEQMSQMQINRMVKELMLDDATSAKFTPIYKEYLKELRECRMMGRKPRPEKSQETTAQRDKREVAKQAMTDEEIAVMLKKQFEQSRKMLDIREKYYAEFSKILSQKQIMKMYQQEKNDQERFQREMERRNNGPRPGEGNRPAGQRPRGQRGGQQ